MDGRPRGVTLTELMLVLTVVLLTAALVMPIFLNARERNRQATCISNLGQIGVAFMEYAQDNDETLFNPYYFEYYKGDRGCGYTSDSTLEPYIRNHAAHDVNCVWVCPDVEKFAMPSPHSRIGFGAFYCTYTMNVYLNAPEPHPMRQAWGALPEPDVCYADVREQTNPTKSWNRGLLPEDKMAADQPMHVVSTVPYVRMPTKKGIRLQQIVAPGRTDLLFEGVVEDYSAEGRDTGYVGRAPREGDYTLDEGFWRDDQIASKKWGYPLQSATMPRHRRFNNYLFCDGHVKALEPKQYPYDIQHDPDNIWFARLGRDGKPIPPSGGPGC